MSDQEAADGIVFIDDPYGGQTKIELLPGAVIISNESGEEIGIDQDELEQLIFVLRRFAKRLEE